MLKAQWMIDRASPASESGGYRLLACVEGSLTLFVIIVGPATEGPPQLKEVGVATPAGERLRWRGQNGTADQDDDLLIAKFDRPSDDVTHLDVSMDTEGAVAYLGRVVRQSEGAGVAL